MTPSSANIKTGLIAAAVVVVLGILWYTQTLVERLQGSERRVVNLFAQAIEYNTNASDKVVGDYSFFVNNILAAIDFPLIQTDAHNEINPPFRINIRNVDLDTTKSLAEQKAYLHDLSASFDKHYPPIPTRYVDTVRENGVLRSDTIILTYVHYGDSPLVRRLQLLPYVEISLGALFIIIGYIGFSTIKRAEQSSIWAGMARETAHQLGTPLSSLLGWSELLHARLEGSPADETVREMRGDIDRLQKVADRFGKIGSKPVLKSDEVNVVVNRVVKYLERRIPQMNKTVAISVHADAHITAPLNAELFEWVIENLLKNALDAIESKGEISVRLFRDGRNAVVEVHDSGKGIDPRLRKDVFRPGYSTKRRGWGLGLSLSKRIVEDYHNGKIFLKSSGVGKGATFRVEIPAA